ncbi:sugar phosphate isomerase/epimerase [Lewinella sp. JB7]|uniref:sugar phosphate isomerase/epimerase family protein n=1 Tax=Lewinella sp. JB7 TaxID=2962887 RepID=UPI0020C9BB32|nr:sugar phosphate isomerase/epimerase [Lewinella sp. JB7]MCP9234678.1 sugar phosphate isomerase/epimerase [Lewinella sp. JB7]
MINSRRTFLRVAGGLSASAALLPLWACGDGGGDHASTETTPPESEERAGGGDLGAFGIQLYTLRDMMPGDPRGTLKQIADMGYKQIEGYEGAQGMFWGMEPQEFKDYLDELGLTMVSTHCNINENFAEKAQQAASIGVEYLICPYIGAQDGKAGWDAVIEKFNECGRICAEHGIRFAYHNHAYTFEEVDGIVPQAYLMDNTDDTVDYEMDIYWVVTGGADPVKWLNDYPGKWRLCHVKDRKKGAGPDEHEASVDLGKGSIDFPRILAVAEEQGMEYYILEQEDYENSTPVKSAAAGARYLADFTFA